MLSTVQHQAPARAKAAIADAQAPMQLNWRLLLALGVNVAAWWTLAKLVG